MAPWYREAVSSPRVAARQWYAAAVKKMAITFVGAGALAAGLAPRLHQCSFNIREIVTRDGLSSRALARRVGANAASFANATWDAGLVWLAVPDAAIASCARRLARLRGFSAAVVLHSSGALGGEILAALRARGVAVGSAHPMMTFVAGEPPQMRGVWWALEGDARAVRAAREIARALGSRSFSIAAANKALYHAFGALLSPMLVSELTAAGSLGLAAGVPRAKLTRVMAPIVQRTVANLLAHGGPAALSGPLVRGDLATIRLHLAALEARPAERRLYLALAGYAAQKLPVKRRKQLLTLLHER